MSQSESTRFAPSDRPHKILSLDGGGIRGVFSIEILARMEELYRAKRGNPNLVLRDEFDLIAGTSTGAIIATMISWGMSVGQIKNYYVQESGSMFTRSGWMERWKSKYSKEKITEFFQELFVEKDGRGAVLGSEQIRTRLLLVMRNASTGSSWIVTNNPEAKFNQQGLEDCNLKIPLWQLVRASTAAPTFFPPEEIRLGTRDFIFIDGGITPYNNPAWVAFLTATLPCYGVNWKTGLDNLRIVSIGTGYNRVKLSKDRAAHINLMDAALYVIPALMAGISLQQDIICRVFGRCEHGPVIDVEMGDLIGHASGLGLPEGAKFSYVRYDHEFQAEDEDLVRRTGQGDAFALDNLLLVPALSDIGSRFAQEHVQPGHLGL